EEEVRRAQQRHVEAVGDMPPVVEGRGGEHVDAAPGAEEASQWAAKSPNFDGSCARGVVRAERGGEDDVGAGEASDDAAEVDQNVRRGPEAVAADALVPGDVPDAADAARGDGDHAGPDVPGDSGGLCARVLGRVR